MCEVAGSPVSALILQVVAYHNLTLVQYGSDKQNYEEMIDHWQSGIQNINGDIPKKLSYAAISEITGIDKETVRRSIKKIGREGLGCYRPKNWNSLSAVTSKSRQTDDVERMGTRSLGRLMERLSDLRNGLRSTV